MSGGAFDYNQYEIERIADEVADMIRNNGRKAVNEFGHPRYRDYPPEVIERFRDAVYVLRKARVYAHRIDWLVSDDDGVDSFLQRLDRDLSEVEEA